MFKKYAITALLFGAIFGLQAQFIQNHSNGMDHNHYSIESIHDDVIMAGTVFPQGQLTNTDIHVQRVDANGNVLWEMYHDIGSDERCLDVSMQGEDIILLTGSNVVDGVHRIFVMRLNPSNGSMIDMVYLYHGSVTYYVEQFGLDILYSETEEKYFIIAKGVKDLSVYQTSLSEEKGMIICLNNDLTYNWAQEINNSNANTTLRQAHFSTITEIPGVGIVVTGEARGASGISGALCFDYSGNLFWNASFRISSYLTGSESTKGAIYDAQSDKFYHLAINTNGSFLIEISNASLSSASITNIADYTDLKASHNIIGRLQFINIDHDNQSIMLAGYGLKHPGSHITNSTMSTFMKVDLNSLAATSINVIKSHNPGISFQDHIYYNISWNGIKEYQAYTKWNDGFAAIAYDYSSPTGGPNTYNLVVNKTDTDGRTKFECENKYNIETTFPQIQNIGTPSTTSRFFDTQESNPSIYIIPHQTSFGCKEATPCGFTINFTSRIEEDCYEYTYNVDLSANSGTYIYEYVWDFGDGNTSTSSNPVMTHSYGSNPFCFYDVCVTVKAIGSDGNLCQETFCQIFYSTTPQFSPCGGCTTPLTPRLKNKTEIEQENEISIAPNPASDQVRIIGFEESADVVITDLTGKVVLSNQINGNYTIDLSSLSKGVYLIRANDALGNSLVEKLIIQ